MATITVGYNKRCWATFEVKDPTPEEIAILEERGSDSDEVTDLLRHLEAEERLIFQSEDQDDNPTYFQEWDEPSVIMVFRSEDQS